MFVNRIEGYLRAAFRSSNKLNRLLVKISHHLIKRRFYLYIFPIIKDLQNVY